MRIPTSQFWNAETAGLKVGISSVVQTHGWLVNDGRLRFDGGGRFFFAFFFVLELEGSVSRESQVLPGIESANSTVPFNRQLGRGRDGSRALAETSNLM